MQFSYHSLVVYFMPIDSMKLCLYPLFRFSGYDSGYQ